MKAISRHYDVAGVLLIDLEGNIIAQLRDEHRPINFPGKATFFGGKVNPGEHMQEAALRELTEETNLRLTAADITPYMTYTGIGDRDRAEQTFNVFIAMGISTEGLEIYEGQGYRIVADMNDPLIAEVMEGLFAKWFAQRDHILQAQFERHSDVHRGAGALLLATDGTLYGHMRDAKPGIDWPGRVGAFGGSVEDGESPLEACERELSEEINLPIRREQLEVVHSFVVWRPKTKEYEQYMLYVARDVDIGGIEVYEGAGIKEITSPHDPLISGAILPGVKKWFERNKT